MSQNENIASGNQAQKTPECGSPAPRKKLKVTEKIEARKKKITLEEQLQNGKLSSKNTTFCL